MNKIKDKIECNNYLYIVLSFALIVTISLIYINSTSQILGINFLDPYFYLIQSLRYAGYYIGGYEFINYYPPLIPFLTSLLFRLGFVNETSIFFITGIFNFIAITGMYYLLKLRFNEKYSAIGAIFYGSLSANIMWVANGTIDIPTIALAIWGVYTFILSIEKDQKYFYISIPLIVLTFFTKYIGGLIGIIVIFYILSKKDLFGNIKKYIKNGIGGLILSSLIIIPFLAHYYINKLPLGFLNQVSDINAASLATTQNDLFFYLSHIPAFIFKQEPIIGALILLIGIFGLIGLMRLIYLKIFKRELKNKKEINDNQIRKISLSILPRFKFSSKFYYAFLIISITLIIISFISAGKNSFMKNELILMIGILLFTICFNSIFSELIKREYTSFNYDVMMFSWFFIYLVFFSTHPIKVDRYFSIFAPPFVFFIILSLEIIIKYIENSSRSRLKIAKKINHINQKCKLTKIIPILFVLICLLTTTSYLTIDKHSSLVGDEKNMSVWIQENIRDYENQTIIATRSPIFTWYLKSEVPFISYETQLKEKDNILREYNASYYICIDDRKIDNYKIIKNIGQVNLYKKIKD